MQRTRSLSLSGQLSNAPRTRLSASATHSRCLGFQRQDRFFYGPLQHKRLSSKLSTAHSALQKNAEAADQLSGKALEDRSVHFSDAFLRTFLLALCTAAVMEAPELSSQLFHSLGKVGSSVWTMDAFLRSFVGGHFVAVSSWIVLYIIDAAPIHKILEKHATNPEAAELDIRSLITLPRILVPRLKALKRAFGFVDPEDKLETQQLALSAVATPVSPPPLETPRLSAPKNSIVTAPPRPKIPSPPILDPKQEPEGPEEEDRREEPKKPQRDKRSKPGQLDIGTRELLHRSNELHGRMCYLKDQWYAVAISEKVKDKPIGIDILGQKVVLYRDSSGAVQCLDNICPHRGAPLHTGWKAEVKGHDCIVCPYHGWAFDGKGHLQDVPAQEFPKLPKGPLIQSFPVEEKGGFVWLFYDGKEGPQMPEAMRPPIPYVKELDDPSWKPVYGDIEFDCNHWSVFENAIDMAHIHYLHSDSFGNTEKPQIKDMTCQTITQDGRAIGIKAKFVLHNKPVSAIWRFSQVEKVNVEAMAFLPSTSVISFTLGKGLSFITFVNTVPISATRTINRYALIRRLDVDQFGASFFNMDIWDSMARQAMTKILSQDKAMVEQLRPEMLGREISVKADLPQVNFRTLRQSYIDRGLGVEPDRPLGWHKGGFDM